MIRINKRLIYGLLLLCWCGIIFLFSAQSGEISSETSNIITGPLFDHFGDGATFRAISYAVRKSAHFLEYLVLGMLALLFLFSFKGKKVYQFLGAASFCIVYASGDEFHQTFVDGRVGALSDVVLDSIGSLIGCLIAILVIYVMHRKERNTDR